MSFEVSAQGEEREIVPMGRYLFTCTDMDVVEKPDNFKEPGQDTHQWLWKFTFMDAEGVEHEQWGYTSRTIGRSRKTGEKYKARLWVEALMGRDIADDERITFPDAVLGKQAWGKLADVKKDGSPGNVILALEALNAKPPKAQRPAQAPQQRQVVPEPQWAGAPARVPRDGGDLDWE